MIVYATSDDLVTFEPTFDPNCVTSVTALLRTASLRVAEAIAGDFYDVDTNGLPTDPPTLQAVKDATCMQALATAALKIDPTVGGVVQAGTLTSVGIGSARKVYADAEQAATARANASKTLVPDAIRILQLAGLASTTVWVYG